MDPRNDSPNSTSPDIEVPTVGSGIFGFFTALKILICIYACVANSVLFYKQRSNKTWFSSDRLLLISILSANILASMVNISLSIIEAIATYADADWLLDRDRILVMVGDTAMISVIISTAVLSLLSFYWIYRFSQKPAVLAPQNETLRTVLIIVLIWTVAGLSSTIGLKPHNDGLIQLPDLTSHVLHYGCIGGLQIFMSLMTFRTHKVSSRLQTDFAVKQVQQNVQLRLKLKQIAERTKILVPLLTAHAILWLLILCVDFIGDKVSEALSAEDNPDFEAAIDCLTIFYCALYPNFLTRNGGTLKQQLQHIFCCRYSLTADSVVQLHFIPVAPAPAVVGLANGSGTGNSEMGRTRIDDKAAHWEAIEGQWDRVEKVKRIK